MAKHWHKVSLEFLVTEKYQTLKYVAYQQRTSLRREGWEERERRSGDTLQQGVEEQERREGGIYITQYCLINNSKQGTILALAHH